MMLIGVITIQASMNENSLSAYRDAVLKNGSRSVLENYSGTGYVFEIVKEDTVFEMLFLFENDVMKQPEGSVFTRLVRTNEKSKVTSQVGWSPISAAECSRFFYVLGYSDIFNLKNKRENEDDPFRVIVLKQGVIYRSIKKKNNHLILIERESGESVAIDYLYNFLTNSFARRLEP